MVNLFRWSISLSFDFQNFTTQCDAWLTQRASFRVLINAKELQWSNKNRFVTWESPINMKWLPFAPSSARKITRTTHTLFSITDNKCCGLHNSVSPSMLKWMMSEAMSALATRETGCSNYIKCERKEHWREWNSYTTIMRPLNVRSRFREPRQRAHETAQQKCGKMLIRSELHKFSHKPVNQFHTEMKKKKSSRASIAKKM